LVAAAYAKGAVRHDPRPEAAAPLHGFFCTGCQRLIHPVTGPAFFGTEKADPLNLELASDEFVQLQTAGDDIAPKRRRRDVAAGEAGPKVLVDLVRKERDLAFEVIPVSEVAIVLDPMSGNAMDFIHFDDLVFARRAAVKM
jgi:hypothetical protein